MRRTPGFGRGNVHGFWFYFAVAFAALVFVTELFSLATPLNGAPDEWAQVIKTAAVVRGQFLGNALPPKKFLPAYREVRVPQAYADVGSDNCVALMPSIPEGTCKEAMGSTRTVSTTTYVSHEPPLYYLLVGWPSLVGTRTSIYWVRFMSVIVNCALLALAVASVCRWSRSMLMIAGTALAITPMSLFLAGAVTPSGLEASSAIAMWVTAAIMVVDYPRRFPTGLLAAFTTAASTLILVRGDSILWVACCGVVLLPVAWKRLNLRELVADLRVRICGGVGLAATTLWLVWFVVGKPLTVVPLNVPAPNEARTHIMRSIFGSTGVVIKEMIGLFGYLDTPSPVLTYLVWIALGGSLVTMILLIGKRRLMLSGGIALIISATLPYAMLNVAARSKGVLAQGRYFLPLVVSLPIIAAAASTQVGLPRRAAIRWSLATVALTSLGQVAAAYWGLRRYLVGSQGPLSPTAAVPGVWHPPLPAWTLDAGFLLGWAVIAVLASLFVYRYPVDDRRDAEPTRTDTPEVTLAV